MDVYLNAIGTAVPPHRISQELHYSILLHANGLDREGRFKLRAIYRNSGIESRHSVLAEFGQEDNEDHLIFHPGGLISPAGVGRRMELFDQYAVKLASEAVGNCLSNAGNTVPDSITHVVTFSCTGMSAPGLDIQLVDTLGLRRDVERTNINFMGCYAAFNALKSAFHIVRSVPGARVLLVGVELCTLHYRKSETEEQMVANALFSDGAAACLLSAENSGSQTCLKLKSFYAAFEPGGKDQMTWRIGDQSFELFLGSYVPDLIEKHIGILLRSLFEKAGITSDQLSFYAIHPGGAKILAACESALGLTKTDTALSYHVLRNYGNMSSVTVLFVLHEILKRLGPEDRSKNLLSCAFGPGLTIESLLAEVVS